MSATKQSNLSIAMDPKLQKQLLSELDALGIDIATFMNMAAKQVIRHHGLPFEVTSRPIPLERVVTRVEAGHVIHHSAAGHDLQETQSADA